MRLIDTNVSLGRWPTRRLALDDTARLAAKLHAHGITEAWAGSFEGLLHRDLTGVNERLTDECHTHGHGLLRPFGSVNPKLPDWEEEVHRCQDLHHMAGIRLHPNYHGYKLDDPAFKQLLQLAAERGLIVQLAVMMEDRRMQSPWLNVAPVELSPLAPLVKALPKLKLVLLNAFQGTPVAFLTDLAKAGNVYFDLGTIENVGGVANRWKEIPGERLVFGSHAPFFILESALLKVEESALPPETLQKITFGNAEGLAR